MVIYKITNLIDGKFYIGKTARTTEKRMSEHYKNARNGVDTYLYRAMRKHGEENFIIETIDNTAKTLEMLGELEVKYISEWSPKYNMTKGGNGGDTSLSPNYRAAMLRRDYRGPNNPRYGQIGLKNPKFGKKYGPKPNISEAKKQPVMANGLYFPSIGECEKKLGIKWYYSSRKYPSRFYLFSPSNPRATREGGMFKFLVHSL